MATFVQLTRADKPNQTAWFNLDLVQSMMRSPAIEESDFSTARPESTQLWFSSHGSLTVDGWDRDYVLETPEEIFERCEMLRQGGR